MTVLKEGVVGGALNLYFIYKFLRILTTPFASTEAFKLGIIDEKGKILKKKSKLKTIEEKEAYTMMHRLVWKLKRLMEKVPFGKSRLASYAAALWLIKEDKNFHGNDKELQESFLSFLETNWKDKALILKENYEGDMDKKTYSNLKEGIDIKKASMGDVIKDFQKSDAPQFKGKSDKKKKEMAVAAKLSKEEVEIDERYYFNIGRGIYYMSPDSHKIDHKKEVKDGYPNAKEVLSSIKQASDYVAKKNNIKEAVLADRDYKYDGKVVKISKKNFSKVHKDFKNSTKGKERMMINDPKTGGSISVPVEFTEEVEIQEVKNNWAVIDTAPSAVDRKKNEIMALATDEKDAHSSIKYSEGPRGYQSVSGKSKKTLKVVRIKKKHDIGDVFKEEVEMEEARKGKLPPHLAKFLDKKGNLKKDAADRVRKGRKERGAKITDRTPKGYGPNEEVEIEEGKFEKGDIVIPNMGPHKGDKHKIIHDFGDGSYNIKPLTHPRNIKYKLGASKAKEKQLKLVKDDSTHKQEIKSKIIDDSYHGTFAGKDVFIVDSDTFHTCRLGKQKYHRYEKYVGNGKIGQAIREFGLANPKKPIILQNGEDGPMLYLRYGGSKRYA